jgi:prepilin-type N-terminal cleavage/methylation domain-containing protein
MRVEKMSNRFRRNRCCSLRDGQKGFTMVELLVALAIFGIIVVGFMSAFVTGYHGVRVADDLTVARNLTRTAFEDVRVAAYPVLDYETTSMNYDVDVGAEYIDGDYVVSGDPTEVQMITVTVSYHDSGEPILVTQGVKVMP